MKIEIEWLKEKIGHANCFIHIEKNNKEQKKVIKLYIEMFSDRIKEIEEFENNELIQMKKYNDRKNIAFCDRCEIDVNPNTHPCFSNPIKKQIRELIKNRDKDGGVSIEDIHIYFHLVPNKYQNITMDDVKQNVQDLLINGEIFESKPNILRWLG